MKTEDDNVRARRGDWFETTYGRVMFNMMLPEGMDYYNQPLKSGDLANVISDCYQRLGRRATIDLLDDMNQLGFHESTRSGLSFATDDLVTPESKIRIITEAEKEVMRFQKLYRQGRDHRPGALQPGAGHLDARS